MKIGKIIQHGTCSIWNYGTGIVYSLQKVCQVTNVRCKKRYELQKFAVKNAMNCKKFGVFFV